MKNKIFCNFPFRLDKNDKEGRKFLIKKIINEARGAK
jgi:hypothetical protein